MDSILIRLDCIPRLKQLLVRGGTAICLIAVSSATVSARQAAETPRRWIVESIPILEIRSPTDVAPNRVFRINGATRLSNGNIVVADCGTNEILIFDSSGRHVHTIWPGGGFGLLARLFRAAGDTIVAHDRATRRTVLFAADGRYVRDFPMADRFEPIRRFADGSFLAYRDGGFDRQTTDSAMGVQRHTDAVVQVGAEGRPLAAPFTIPGREYVVAGGIKHGEWFYRGLSLAVFADGFYAGTQDTSLISAYRPDGQPLTTFNGIKSPTAIPPEVLAQRRYGWARPAALPAYGAFLNGANNELWVRDGQRERGTPLMWTVYQNGRAIARVQMPAFFTPFEFGSDWVLGRFYDGTGSDYVSLLRLQRTSDAASLAPVTGPSQIFHIGCYVSTIW